MNTQKDTYPNALTDSEWEHIMPYLPSVSLIGRPRKYEWRTVLDGIFYLLRTGCQWRYIPRDLAPWQVCYRTFHKLDEYEFWQKLNRDLSVEYRLQQGREAEPSAGVIDSQTAKSTPTSSSHGYDAGKKTKGTKRHLLVDSLGLLLGVVVHCASIVDCRGAALLFERAAATGAVGKRFEHIWADGGYDRVTTYGDANQHGWRLEVLLRPEGAKSFVVIERRWVVERTFSC
jgi:putative transposase